MNDKLYKLCQDWASDAEGQISLHTNDTNAIIHNAILGAIDEMLQWTPEEQARVAAYFREVHRELDAGPGWQK